MKLDEFKTLYENGLREEIITKIDDKIHSNNSLRSKIREFFRKDSTIELLANIWKKDFQYDIKIPTIGSYKKIRDYIDGKDYMIFFIKMEIKEKSDTKRFKPTFIRIEIEKFFYNREKESRDGFYSEKEAVDKMSIYKMRFINAT